MIFKSKLGLQNVLVIFKTKSKSDSSTLAAVEFYKVFDLLTLGLKQSLLFKPVTCKDFSETVIPSLQKSNVKKPFCNLKIVIFLIALLYSAKVMLNPQVKCNLNAVCTDDQQYI